MKINEDTGMPDFEQFPKIPRLYKGYICVTEKIDGTNGQLYLEEYERRGVDDGLGMVSPRIEGAIWIPNVNGKDYAMFVGSRTRWLQPHQDNFGFYAWAFENARALAELGAGHHYGEWWGRGIQRGYGQHRRTFSLFNTGIWYDPRMGSADGRDAIPGVEGLSVVPLLYTGPWFGRPADPVAEAMRRLEYSGSTLDRGTAAEGVMVYHEASGYYLKAPLNDNHKGA